MVDLRIEKSRLPIVLITVDGRRLGGDMFVTSNPRSSLGFESAPEVLNGSDPFFPLATLDGQTLLVAKAQVRELFVAREDVEEPEWEIGTPAQVELRLVDGPVVSGTILIQMPSPRVLDFLNRQPDRFLVVYVDDGVVLVNRDRIAHATQVAT